MMKVLVVEDDYFSSRLVFEILTAQGIKVEVASDGPEAISITENELYDLILMDIELAKMDGIEAHIQTH
jgi:two-component system, sensor histidine kinase